MLFDDFVAAETALLWGAFAIALVMGAVVNKTNFCTMGAVSDLVNMGDTGRIRAWLFAIAVAVLGVALLEYGGLVEASSTFPPYRGGSLLLAENILGGLMFGIGMTLASGCGNKTLIPIGGGNIKSLVVFAIVAGAFLVIYGSPVNAEGDQGTNAGELAEVQLAPESREQQDDNNRNGYSFESCLP